MSSELEHALGVIYEDFVERLGSAIGRALRGVSVDDVEKRPATTPATTPEPAQPNSTGWIKITEAHFMSGRNRRVIRHGSPVKVQGLGRGGGIGSGWMVIDLEQRGDDVNVSVQKGKGSQPRIVKLDRIIYVRPRGV